MRGDFVLPDDDLPAPRKREVEEAVPATPLAPVVVEATTAAPAFVPEPFASVNELKRGPKRAPRCIGSMWL
jgi:hypothetical protein